MPVQNTKSIQTNKNKIVLSMKDDDSRRIEAKGMSDLSRKIRESGYNVSKCVLAIHDSDVATFFNVPPSDSRNYAVIDFFGNSRESDRELKMKEKMIENFLLANKYRPVANKIIKKEYPVIKIVVKF